MQQQYQQYPTASGNPAGAPGGGSGSGPRAFHHPRYTNPTVPGSGAPGTSPGQTGGQRMQHVVPVQQQQGLPRMPQTQIFQAAGQPMGQAMGQAMGQPMGQPVYTFIQSGTSTQPYIMMGPNMQTFRQNGPRAAMTHQAYSQTYSQALQQQQHQLQQMLQPAQTPPVQQQMGHGGSNGVPITSIPGLSMVQPQTVGVVHQPGHVIAGVVQQQFQPQPVQQLIPPKRKSAAIQIVNSDTGKSIFENDDSSSKSASEEANFKMEMPITLQDVKLKQARAKALHKSLDVQDKINKNAKLRNIIDEKTKFLLNELKGKSEQMTTIDQDMKANVKILEEKLKQNGQFGQQVTKMRNKVRDKIQLQTQIDKGVKTLETRIEEKLKEVKQLEQEIKQLSNDVKGKSEQKLKIDQDIKTINDNVAGKVNQMTAIDEEVKTLKDNIESTKQQVSSLAQEIKVQENCLTTLEKEKRDMDTERNVLKQDPYYRSEKQVELLSRQLQQIEVLSASLREIVLDNDESERKSCPVCYEEARQVFSCTEM